MKTKLLSLLAFMPMLLITPSVFGQETVLAVGDIAVIHVRSDGPDRFAFVTFVDLAENTGIYFSDCGADAAGFNSPCTEGAVKYTVPTGGLNAGAIVQYEAGATNAGFSNYTDSRITGSLGLSGNGDQITVFQDNSDAAGGSNAANNATFIFIAHNSSTVFTGDKTDSNQSGLPPGLSDASMPRTALGLGADSGAESEVDNVIYNDSYDFSGFATEAESIAAAKNALTNPANYYGSDSSDATYESARAAIPTTLILSGTLSTEDIALDSSLVIYPNPSNGNITIKNAGIALDAIEIIDLNGRIIAQRNLGGTTNHKELDLSTVLSSGIYLARISSETAFTIKKIVIQ